MYYCDAKLTCIHSNNVASAPDRAGFGKSTAENRRRASTGRKPDGRAGAGGFCISGAWSRAGYFRGRRAAARRPARAFLPIAIANAAGAAFGAPPLLLKLATSAWALPRPRACDSQPHNGEDDEEFAAAAAVISRHHHFCRGGGDAGDRRKAVHSLSTGLERPRSDAPNGLALVRIPPRSPRSSPTARTHWPRRLTLRCCYCCCCLGLLVEYCVSA
jgi:hypothetical protein